MREELFNLFKLELIGPSSLSKTSTKFEKISEPPTKKYLTGIIFPQHTKLSQLNIDEEVQDLHNSNDSILSKEIFDDNIVDNEASETESELHYNEARECNYLFGLSFAIKESDYSEVKINYKSGIYKKVLIESKEKFIRKPIDIVFDLESLDEGNVKSLKEVVFKSNELTDDTIDNIQHLSVFLKSIIKDSLIFVTLKVVNTYEELVEEKNIADKCFFQNEIIVSLNDSEFQPINNFTKSIPYHQDDINNKLLYLHKPSYAFGYNCSVEWTENISFIKTSFMPSSIIKSIDHNEISQKFSMLEMSKEENWEAVKISLEELCSYYEIWIKEQETLKTESIYLDYQNAIDLNISECISSLKRMKNGLFIIDNNIKAQKAFQLMNSAMYHQQLNSNKGYRMYDLEKNKFEDNIDMSSSNLGYWRLFQIAFILLNIEGIVDKNSEDREIVDLIWFTTGGGKTEAYLALSSFCIFLRRLLNPQNIGLSVLMRYTLRLLTAQQFQRASALICAMEYIREKNPELGDKEISLGLWVGNSVSPSNFKDAYKMYQDYQDKGGQNPFVVTQCPWCGCQLGYVEIKKSNKKSKRCLGYYSSKNDFYFKCANNECYYSNKKIPLKVIDESIYNNPPDFLISTIDKFALIPWNEKVKNIFNLNTSNDSIDLIIQDELHLINGALGTVAGIYEILIQSLIEKKKNKPKIIASTATINRYVEQVKNLYYRDKVSIFPKPILKFGETFFSFENKDDPGRMYVGVMPSSKVMFLSSQIVFVSMLLFAVSIFGDNVSVDYYWTLVLYFNNLKDLGFISAKIESNIRDRLNVLYNNLNYPNIKKRQYELNKQELTSRINSQEIAETFNSLKRKKTDEQKVVDICLGTNMISVGIDVKRLGLMTIISQPILTAEYIQCSSRVGRDKNGPGLVFVLYNQNKNRDKSVYEDFQSFHLRLYSYVEPSTITPYSLTAQKRLLHSVIIGYERMIKTNSGNESVGYIDYDAIKEFKDFLEHRLKINKDKEYILKYFDILVEDWENYCPTRYGNYFKQEHGDLFYPASIEAKESIDLCLWPLPLSMRSVEKECQLKIISNHED